jgi:phospholipid/cholesterol/gamma-HCH transport system substrate-binding protein
LGERVPSQKQLQWSQLKVGLTVVFASVTLGVLLFLMTGTGGLFTPKLTLRAYFDNASGLRKGAPVRLSGVDIGSVTDLQIVPSKQPTPVEVTMTVSSKHQDGLRKDSLAELSTAGVLGETYIDIDSSQAKGPEIRDGDTLPAHFVPDFSDVVRASQSTLQNLQALETRVDRILAFVESGNGSVGKLIYDPALYNRLNGVISQFQTLVTQVNEGKGTLGKLVADDELYNKLNGTVDKVNVLIDDLNAGKGTAGKLLKDPALYDNANQTIANVKQLTDDINAGKGALGKFAKDEVLANKLQNTINKLSDISDQLAAGQGTAGKFLHDSTLYDNSNNLLLESRELIKAVRQDPKKYLTIKLKIF